MDLAKFESLYEKTKGVNLDTAVDSGISEEKFNSLYSSISGTAPVAVPKAAPPVAVDSSLPPQLTPVVTSKLAPPSVLPESLPEQTQEFFPQPGLAKPALPKRPQLVNPNVLPQKTFKAGDIGPSLVSGTKATLGRFYNLVALKEKATRENPRLMQSRSGLTDPYSNMWMSMLPTPMISPEVEEQSKKFENEMLKTGSEYLRQSAEEGRPLTWEEWEGFGGFLDYATGVAGQAGPSLLVGMVSMGTASPLLLEAEVNDELRTIPDLSSEEQLRLVEAGGLIAGTLEMMGLSVLARGIPKGLLAKLGTGKISAAIEKMAGKNAATQFAQKVGQVGGRAVTGGLGEGLTELAQDEVIMTTGEMADKEYSDDERASRRLNSFMAGMTMGAPIRTGVGAIQDVSGAIQERSADKDLSQELNRVALKNVFEDIKSKLKRHRIPEPTQAPPNFSEFTPEPVAPSELRIEVPPEPPAGTTVPTPQSPALSPEEVQESTEETPGENPLNHLKDEKFINTYPDATIDSLKSKIKEVKEGDLIGGGRVGSEVTEEQKEEIIEWIDQNRRSRDQRPEEDEFWKEALEKEEKRELVPEHGYDENEKKAQIKFIQEQIKKGSTPDLEAEWEDYKNAKGKTLAQIKKIGEAKWWGEEDKPRPIVVRKNKDGIFRVAQFYGTDLSNIPASQLFTNAYGGFDNVPTGLLNKFATEEEATEAAKSFLKEPEVAEDLPPKVQDETIPDTKEGATPEAGWEDRKNAKGKVIAQIKKVGETEFGAKMFPVVIRFNKAAQEFKVVVDLPSGLKTVTPNQLFGPKTRGKNSFTTEEEATEAAKAFIGERTEEVVEEPVVEELPLVEEEPKPELPQVEVKEEVALEQQPIKADPEAKEGEPGFKRKALPGTNNEVITPDSSMKVNTTYKIVSLSELLQGEGDFQNRIDRQTSQQALDKIQERAALFDPAQVIDPHRTSDSGPPIILPSGVIISGNGRVLTIKKLYEDPEFKKQKEDYQMALFTKYKAPGDKNPFVTVNGGVIKDPVLVQVLNTAKLAKDDASRRKRIIKFVKASNISKADTLSVGEKAANDVKGTKKIISLFKGGEITSLANAPFIQAFAEENVPSSERGEFFTEGAELSNSGLKRIQGALLTAAYGDSKSITKILESTDNDVKAITNSMLDVAPKYVELKAGMDKDTIPKDMDLTPYIVKALDKISSLRQQGIKPAGDFAQTDFLAEREEIRDIIVKAFYSDDLTRARSQKYITNILNKTIDKILEQDYTEGLPGLAEVSKTSSATEILDAAIQETKQEDERARNVSKNQGELIPPEAAPGGVDQGSGRGRSTKPKPKRRRAEAAKKASGKDLVQWTNPDFSASAREQIFFDLAVSDESMAESLSMEERIGIIKNLEPRELDKLLRGMVQKKFGLKYVEKKAHGGGNEAALIDSINNMINAYHNLQGMAAALGLPLHAIGLEGTLGLRSEGPAGKARGMAAFYQPSISNDPLGPPYITIKERFNVFAHEWGHALDYFLLGKLGQNWSRGMSHRLRGKSILDEDKVRIEPWQATESADKLKYAFGDLLNAMFQEEGDTAAKILELENKISNARSDKVIKDYERQLQDLFQGMSKKRIAKSKFYEGAKGQAEKSDYYSRPTEMLARAFEAYVSHRITLQSEGRGSPGSEFLTMPEAAYAVLPEDAIQRVAIQDFVNRYPKESERLLIFEKFDTLFEMLQNDILEGIAANPDKSPMVEWTAQYEQGQNNNPLSKKAWAEHNRMLRVNHRIFLKTQEQPIKHPHKTRGERWWIAMEDGLIHPWLGTKYGTILSMMKRYEDKPQAHGAIKEIFEKIGIEPGGETTTSNTYPEAVRREVRRLSYAFKTMVDRHNGFEFDKKQENDLRLLLTSDPKTITKAMKGEMSPKVLKLAGDLRNLLNKMYHDVKKSGVNIDYLESNAYLPRILDVPKVFADQKGFISKAYNLFSEVIWIDQEMDFDGYDQDQILSVGSIAKQKKFYDPEQDDYINLVIELKSKRKEIEKMEMADAEPDDIEKAEIALEEWLADNQEVIEEGYDTTRDLWSKYLASDWNLRIHQMAGEDPSASSPMANFTKKRVMPKEADSYMIEFYTDPIDAIGKYITGATRKAEYSKRFGRHLIPTGKKRFAVTKQLQDYLDYLFREKMAGEVDPSDVQSMRADIDAILGRTAPSDMGLKKTLNTAHSYALMGMLTRAVLTSIPEPFVAGIKMRSSIKGLKTFGLTLQEALTYVSKDAEQTIQKRRQVANILGLLDDPSVGEMASNRAGGTMMDDPKNQSRMNLWFVRVGLQGLTNAQRRATMTVSFQYLKELGMQYLAPVGDSEQAAKDNKKEAELVLLDLGIPTSQMEEFATYMNDITLVKGLPDPGTLMTQEGDLTTMSELLAISAGRIVERSIQDPLIGNRPRYAEHPLGKFVYSIQSFNYSFQQNVIVGEGKHIKRLYKEVGGKRAGLRVMQLLGPIAQLYVAHALVSAAREFAMNRERWEEKKEEDKLGSHIAGLTVSRAGTFGAWDPMVNAYTGLRYQRDLSNFMIGAIGSWYTKPTEDIIKLFSGDTNSPNTTSTEERALRAAYQLFIVPMMVFAMSNPKFLSVLGPFAGPTAGALAMAGTSHTVKKAVSSKAIELVYGSKGDMSRRKSRKARKSR